MLLKAKIKNVDEWKAVLNAIGDIVDEVMFICNDDGITFRGTDPAHVALLDVTFPKSSFESFEAKTSFFGLKVDEFKHVLNATNSGDQVEFQIEDPGSVRVSISGTLNMEYNIRLIERTEVNVPIPKTEYKSKISLSSTTLSRIMSNLHQVSDYVTIDCFPDKIEFYGKGDAGDARINIEKENPELYEINSSELATSVYSLEYMAKIIRDIGRASKKVNFEYSTHNPIHMQFDMLHNPFEEIY